jgi:hypothetical protein
VGLGRCSFCELEADHSGNDADGDHHCGCVKTVIHILANLDPLPDTWPDLLLFLRFDVLKVERIHILREHPFDSIAGQGGAQDVFAVVAAENW